MFHSYYRSVYSFCAWLNPAAITSFVNLSLILFFLPESLHAGPTDRVEVINHSPFIGVLDHSPLPYAGPRTDLPRLLTLNLDLSSHFTQWDNDSEFVYLDGETHRWTIRYQQRIDVRMSAGIGIHYLSHRGGFLDSFILDWHKFIGKGDRGRDEVNNDMLRYEYIEGGRTRYLIDDPADGFGDIELFVQWRPSWANSDKFITKTKLNISLPTGDNERLTGSGGFSAGFGLRSSRRLFETERAWWWSWGAGFRWLSSVDVLSDHARDLVGYAHTSLSWEMLSRLTVKIQYDLHTSFFKHSSLRQLNDTALIWAVGADIRISDRSTLDLAVVEDESLVGASPDVTFQLAFRKYF